MKAMRELVIQPLPGIGDMVWHLPHIHAIAAANPDGKVDVLTKRRSLADRLLLADPAVAEVLWLERDARHAGVAGLLRLARELRARGYRRAWILHGSVRYALAAWLAGIPERIGYGFGAQKHFVRRVYSLPAALRALHPIDKATALLQRAGMALTETEPRLVVEAAQRAQIEQHYTASPRPWSALGIGSSEPAKQWGADKFATLARALLERGGTCFLIGGPDEAELAERIARQAEASAERLVRVIGLPIDAVAALLACCDRYVGNDTGVLNLAAAVGVQCVGIFGASMPLRHSRFITCIEPDASVVMDRRGAGLYADGARGMASIGVDRVLLALKGE